MATYDPKKVFAIYGLLSLSDFGEGTFIECTPDQEDFKTIQGTDGTVDFIRNIGRTYTVKVQIMQTSKVNDLLSASRLLDLTTNTGTWPLVLKDIQGLSLFFFKKARIMNMPTTGYGSTTQNREWVFKCMEGEIFVGGNIIN